jgi:hypothetical protein
VQAFNADADVKSIITTDAIRGKRVPPGVFKVFSLNNKRMASFLLLVRFPFHFVEVPSFHSLYA